MHRDAAETHEPAPSVPGMCQVEENCEATAAAARSSLGPGFRFWAAAVCRWCSHRGRSSTWQPTAPRPKKADMRCQHRATLKGDLSAPGRFGGFSGYMSTSWTPWHLRRISICETSLVPRPPAWAASALSASAAKDLASGGGARAKSSSGSAQSSAWPAKGEGIRGSKYLLAFGA